MGAGVGRGAVKVKRRSALAACVWAIACAGSQWRREGGWPRCLLVDNGSWRLGWRGILLLTCCRLWGRPAGPASSGKLGHCAGESPLEPLEPTGAHWGPLLRRPLIRPGRTGAAPLSRNGPSHATDRNSPEPALSCRITAPSRIAKDRHSHQHTEARRPSQSSVAVLAPPPACSGATAMPMPRACPALTPPEPPHAREGAPSAFLFRRCQACCNRRSHFAR